MLRNRLLVLLSAVCLKSFSQPTNPTLHKLSPSLQNLQMAKKGADSIVISLSAKKGEGLRALQQIASASSVFFFTGKIAVADLLSLAQDKEVLFISEAKQPKEEINTGASDPTLNTIFFTQHQFPALKGEGIAVSVKERLFDTTDIDLKGRVFPTGLEHNSVTAHASLMTTIIAGAGNSSPFAKGAAPAALVSSVSFNQLFPETDSFYRTHSISVQNHSYGTVVENFYGNEAVAFDQSSVDNVNLLHIFSAGNAGNGTPASGLYSGMEATANLTGNFKQAKNTVTVSGVDSLNGLLPLSSAGPAYDGRVKPELVAYGEDGSSGAAALVSGASALIQDRYRQRHGGLPASALTKAVLLNSAADVGAKGIDFRSGYGSLNTYQAVQTINEGRYFLDSVSQSSAKTFRIVVPAKVAQLKITLVWTDLPAAPNAAKALVNDLDIVLQSVNGEKWLPWVLNHAADKDSLLLPPLRQRDTLNNVEQISLDNPPAGEYTVTVTGTEVQAFSQRFAVAYEWTLANSFFWTFPTASDHLVAGNRHTLRWHTNLPGTATIEYATNGTNWRTAGFIDTLQKNSLRWTVPDTVSTAQLRLTTGATTFLSDSFTINPQPVLQTGFNCADSFLLYWNKQGAERYRLYRLGEKYLEPTLVTTDTAVVLAKTNDPSFYYSVAPLIGGKEGLRSSTADYTALGAGCYFRSFYLQTQTATAANFVAEIGTLYKVASVSLEVLNGVTFTPLQTITLPRQTRFSFQNIPLHAGENRFRFRIQLTSGVQFYSNIETVYTVRENMHVFVYPNPVAQSSSLKILTREVGRFTMTVYDNSGKKVYENELNSSVSFLPVSRFAKGLYVIMIQDRDGKTEAIRQVIF